MKVETMAKEIHDEIGKDVQGIHPWQYQNLNLVSINYDAILEDIKTYWNQDARFREGFKVEDKNIYVPNFFTKINGIHKSKNEYIKFVQSLKDSKNTLVLENNFNFPIILEEKNDEAYYSKTFLFEKEEYSKCVNKDDSKKKKEPFYYPISKQNILKYNFLGYKITYSNFFTFENLTSSKQDQLLRIMDKIKEENKFKWSKNDFERFYSVCFSLPEEIISLINNYDYSFEVPKIIFINSDINWNNMVMLNILNEFAFDILLLQPSGKSSIEKYMDINELSLGYFEKDFDIKENLLTKKELKQIKKNDKKKHITFKYKNDIICNLINIVFLTLAIIAFVKIESGITNTLIEFGVIVFYILFSLFLEDNQYDENCRIWNGNLYYVIVILNTIIIVAIMLARLWSFTESDIITIDKGYMQIEEQAIEGNDNFIMKYKKDAVLNSSSNIMYCYIENNSQNTKNMYFKLFIGNTEIYKSTIVKPFYYVSNVTIRGLDLPSGDTKINIKFYESLDDEETLDDDSLDSETTKMEDTLLGEGSFTCHVYDNNNSYYKACKKYNLNNN